jgi:O-antigen/teichoic acid export membrane protein
VNYLTGSLQGAVFLFHILAARLFGAAAYGAYRWAWSLIEVALQIGLWGVNQAVLRGVAAAEARQDPGERRSVVGTAIGAVLLWSTAAALALLLAPDVLFGRQLPPDGAITLRALAPMIPIWSVMMLLVAATMATRSMRSNFLVRGLTYPIVINLVLLAIAAVWPRSGARAIAWSQVCAGASALVVAVIAYRYRFHEAPPIVWWPARWDRQVLAFAVPVGAAEVVNQTLTRIDMVLLGLLRPDPRELAAYGAAMMLAEAVSGPRYAFDPLLSAVVAATHASGDRERLERNLRDMVNRVSLLACPIAVACLVWGDGLLRLWGAEYTMAFTALALLLMAHLVNASLGLHQWVVVMSGHPTLDVINNICALTCATAVCLILIPRIGLTGAAAGALTAVGTLRGLQLVESQWLEGVHGLSPAWMRIAIAGIVSALLQLAIRVFWGLNIGAALIGTALGVAVYLAVTGQWTAGLPGLRRR